MLFWAMLIDFHTHINHFKAHQLSAGNDVLSVFSFSMGEDVRECNWMSIGWHPWHIVENKVADTLLSLDKYIRHYNPAVIGECGIDKCCANTVSLALQQKVFEYHLQLSEKYSKPLVIHCVKSFNELVTIKRRYKPKQPWIVHGYNNNVQISQMLLNEGMLLSFGSALLKIDSNARKVLADIDNHLFFLETDGKEVSIEEIYKVASEVRKTPVNVLENILQQNFERIIF